MIVGLADPRAPGPAPLLTEGHAVMARLFPAEENHHLSLDELAADHVRFVAATEDGATVGTGAIALHDDHAEVKSMFTAPAARGRGVADAILSHLIALAAAEGRPLMRLETGRGLDAALRLYARHGFAPRDPFGTYPENDTSLFYERPS